ncbi:MAG: TetR family transcriptional regulator C-terminal domain-containing protein [Roseburia sp.]|nr:TetR family transcriptional regulator C-terminal domain-containing protein [Roseburia sp.]
MFSDGSGKDRGLYRDRLCLNCDRRFSIPDTDRLLLTRFYKCALVGVTLDWLNHEMNYDLSGAASHLCDLLEGSGKRAFLKNAIQP